MTYVDDLKQCRPVDESGGRWRWRNYCHLFSDSLDDLHAHAAALGLKRAYFQDLPGFPHYDLTKTKRALAIKNGAQKITTREMVTLAQMRFPAFPANHQPGKPFLLIG